MQIHTLISLVLAVLICGMAMWRGDKAARWSGAVLLTGWLSSLLIYSHNPHSADYGVLAVDILTLAGFVWVSVRTRRIWTALASAFMALIVASHIAVMIDLRVTLGTLLISMAMWSYGVLACIAFGVWTSWRTPRGA